MRKSVIVTLRVFGQHNWPDAPYKRGYLQFVHPHQFTFVVTRTVTDSNREVEFHDLRDQVSAEVRRLGLRIRDNDCIDFGWQSCEMLAEGLLSRIDASAVEVWEDEDCGARVQRDETE